MAYITFFGLCVNYITSWSRANQGNIWKSLFCCHLAISSSCMLISHRFTFIPQCHDFYARDSQHYKLMEWIEIGQSADMRRRRVAAVPDASTRAFTLQSQPDAYRLRPLRTPPDVVSVYRTNPTQCVHGQPNANRSRTVSASGKIVSVYTAQVRICKETSFNYPDVGGCSIVTLRLLSGNMTPHLPPCNTNKVEPVSFVIPPPPPITLHKTWK